MQPNRVICVPPRPVRHDDDYSFVQPNARAVQPARSHQSPNAEVASAVTAPGSASPAADSDVFQRYRDIDRWLLSSLGQVTGGLAPATFAAAGLDWWTHLLASPAKRLEVMHEIATAGQRWVDWSCGDRTVAGCPFEPLPQDKRFTAPEWQQWPYAGYAQAFLLAQHLWQRATSGVPGVTRHHEAMVAFCARQWLDMVSPTNGVFTNPVVLQRTFSEGGANLMRGVLHAVDDAAREALQPAAGGRRRILRRQEHRRHTGQGDRCATGWPNSSSTSPPRGTRGVSPCCWCRRGS